MKKFSRDPLGTIFEKIDTIKMNTEHITTVFRGCKNDNLAGPAWFEKESFYIPPYSSKNTCNPMGDLAIPGYPTLLIYYEERTRSDRWMMGLMSQNE